MLHLLCLNKKTANKIEIKCFWKEIVHEVTHLIGSPNLYSDPNLEFLNCLVSMISSLVFEKKIMDSMFSSLMQ